MGEHVSITHLLTETCGFVVPDLADAQVRERLTLQGLFIQLRSATALFRPGRVFSASLVHQALLARVLEVLAGRPIHLVLHELLHFMLRSASGTDPNVSDPHLQVTSHVFNYNARAALASPPEPLTDFLRLSCGHLHLSPIHLATILQEIESAHATTLKCQRVDIPYLNHSPGAEETPVGAGTGCHAYQGDWFGLDGPAIGQTLCARFHGTHRIAVVIGANAHAPHAIDTVRQELYRSLGLAQSPPRSHGQKSTPVSAGEAAGEYRGMTGGRIVVERLESDLLACAIFVALAGGKPVVLKLLDPGSGHWQPTTQLRPFNMGFFRDPDTQDPCILVGNTAYRKS
jgi:hypothetical protein